MLNVQKTSSILSPFCLSDQFKLPSDFVKLLSDNPCVWRLCLSCTVSTTEVNPSAEDASVMDFVRNRYRKEIWSYAYGSYWFLACQCILVSLVTPPTNQQLSTHDTIVAKQPVVVPPTVVLSKPKKTNVSRHVNCLEKCIVIESHWRFFRWNWDFCRLEMDTKLVDENFIIIFRLTNP